MDFNSEEGDDGKMSCSHRAGSKERYEQLELLQSLNWRMRYAAACKELAFILRNAYSKSPKILQNLIFHDTLSAFRLLPGMPAQAAISSANILLQNAEFALPKQKKVLAVAAFKRAMVTSKRQSKSQQQQEAGLLEFPQDVLIHVFSYLDLQSLVSAAMVSKSWSSTASDDYLWESLYVKFFGIPETCTATNGHSNSSGRTLKYKEDIDSRRIMEIGSNTHGRLKFKCAYGRLTSKKVATYRGYCRQCDSVVWLPDSKCYHTHSGRQCGNPNIIPISMREIVDYVLYDSLPESSDSDSDSDSDDLPVFKLWAYPNHKCIPDAFNT